VLILLISAVWGSAFLFYAYLTPRLGVFLTAGGRLLLAGLFLVGLFAVQKRPLGFRSWKVFLVVGVLNSAIPFVLYSWASLRIPSSVEVVLNALTPVFGALFSYWFLGERLTRFKTGGIVLGFAGVLLIAGLGPFPLTVNTVLGCLACLAATASYALAAIYLRRRATHLTPAQNAAGSQLLAGVLLVPLSPVGFPGIAVTGFDVAVLVLFALLCSALAYLWYYRLVEIAGATTALAVTFPMPVFGFLWGALLLGERFTLGMVAGTVLVLGGMALLTRTKAPTPTPTPGVPPADQ
jgi:drug/metabolite transporter (DMT)-like permease